MTWDDSEKLNLFELVTEQKLLVVSCTFAQLCFASRRTRQLTACHGIDSRSTVSVQVWHCWRNIIVLDRVLLVKAQAACIRVLPDVVGLLCSDGCLQPLLPSCCLTRLCGAHCSRN